MKKYLKIIIIIFIIILLALGVPLIINLLFKYNSNIEIFRSEWTAGDALAFYGSILGSSITLVGIWYTIKNESKKRIEDIELQYRPILKLSSDEYNDSIVTNGELDIISNGNNFRNNHRIINKYFYLKNIGRGEMIDVNLSNLAIESINYSCNLKGIFSCITSFDEIAMDDLIKFCITVPEPYRYTVGDEILYKISFDINYYGCMRTKKYFFNVSMCLSHKFGSKHCEIYNYRIRRKKGC